MPTPLSANMNLPIPIPTVTEGAQYAFDEQSCFNKIDAHNHTNQNGVQIPTGGLNINANLPMNNYGLLNTQFVNLQDVGSITTSGSLFRITNDLYFKDGAGNNVRITQNGSVAVSGAIGFTGLPSGNASASYSAPAQAFIFESATNTPANVDMASAIIRPLVANANGITIGAPALLPADYSLELPSALPAITSLAQVGATGAISYANADNSSLELVASVLKIKDLGVTTAKINNLAVTTAKIADSNVTTVKIADQNVTPVKRSPGAYSRSSVSFGPTTISPSEQTIGSVSIVTTASNKVAMAIFGVESLGGYYGGGGGCYVLIRASGPSLASTVVAIAQPGYSGGAPGGISATYPIIGTITLPSTGTYTFSATIRSDSGAHTGYVTGCFLSAAELG